jgi:pre-rRNA-processing protein TSR4
MEWGTIILGVCAKDCAPQKIGVVGWREEWAGVQWEEMK